MQCYFSARSTAAPLQRLLHWQCHMNEAAPFQWALLMEPALLFHDG
jgi:hypothetical protein